MKDNPGKQTMKSKIATFLFIVLNFIIATIIVALLSRLYLFVLNL